MSAKLLYDNLFEKRDCLGKGGFGEVCKAITKPAFTLVPVGTVVAVKLIKIDILKPTQVKDLKREIDILSVVSSYANNKCYKNIVCYYGSVEVEKDGEDYFAIVMEFIDGFKLSDYIDSLIKNYIDPMTGAEMSSYELTTEMTNEQIAGLMKQLLLALDYMHSLNIVHRDIKTDNIMYIPKSKILKYIDFGFSCFAVLDDVEHKCNFKTVGTPFNIAPELWKPYLEILAGAPIPTDTTIKDSKEIEMLKKADMWALGMVFYELLYGLVPYDLDKVDQIAIAIADKTQPVEFFEFEGDEYLEKLVKKMLFKRYKLRPTAKMAYQYLVKKYPD